LTTLNNETALDVCLLVGGAISNLYAVAVARYKAEPRSKQQGMTSLTSRLVIFTSEHVSNDIIHPVAVLSDTPEYLEYRAVVCNLFSFKFLYSFKLIVIVFI